MVDPAFDDREQHPDQPGIHALIIGVSDYTHLPAADAHPSQEQEKYGLGLTRLSAAASTGFLVYEWLLASRDALPLPLLTCRLLLAPSADELQRVDGLGALGSDATLKSVLAEAKAWRNDAATHRDGLTFFYFAGHGLRRKRGDHVLVLQDVGDGLGQRLQNAVDTFTLVQGMAPSEDHPEIARRQLYFFDACQMRPIDAWKYEDEGCTGVFDKPTIQEDDRAAPEYYTALPGMTAFALPGEQTVFSKALLKCLRGAVGERRGRQWGVTLLSLNKGLQHHLADILDKEPEEQMFRVDGLTENLLLLRLAEPPDVELVLQVVPGKDAARAEVTVSDLKHPALKFGPPLHPHPYSAKVKAGAYQVSVQVSGASGNVSSSPPELLEASPPYDRWELAV
jgi:hypothetical protein